MQKPDQLRVTFDQNPAMSEATANAKPGDKVVLEVHCTLKAKDAEGVDLTIEAAVPEGYEVDPDKPETGMSMGMDSVMTPTAMMVRKKAQS